jgi:glutamate dehydrogenase (NADP+)
VAQAPHIASRKLRDIVTSRTLDSFLAGVSRRDPNQPEFFQAVKEVMMTLWPFVERNPRYGDQALLERLVEPERVIQFRVAWTDDRGQVQVNRAFRVQHSSAIGPYKGGMRFHPTVNLSVLKFLGFEQTFKNALTTLPMGGGKGGSDFDPKGKSDAEVMRFCQALITELYRHLGPDTDVPAGDIGVGARSRLYGRHDEEAVEPVRLRVHWQGSGLRRQPDASRGHWLRHGVLRAGDAASSRPRIRRSARAAVGLGQRGAIRRRKAIELGAKVLTVSDSGGVLHFPEGMNREQLDALMTFKNDTRGRLSDFAEQHGLRFEAGKTPWHVPADVALPCATQNELNGQDAERLLSNGVFCVAEGANMPSTLDAVDRFVAARILYAPGKASNAGGVATSGLEMSQNAMRMAWHHAEIDEKLHAIMKDIHGNCIHYGQKEDGYINYVEGANIAGFVKVADAMLAQGVI